MSSDLDVFVVVHSQELVRACEEDRRFAGLPRFTYLFVGGGDTSEVDRLKNLIIARDLPDNIEYLSNLLSFTAWYAIARNRLAIAPRVAVLEYDVTLAPDFHARTLECLGDGGRVVGFVPFPLSHVKYLHATHWLADSLRDVHALDVAKMVENHLAQGGKDEWTATSNIAMTIHDLEDFVDWYLPAAELFVDDSIGAHVHERAVPIYCMVNELENVVLSEVLRHEQRRSHSIRIRSDEEITEAVRSPAPTEPPPDRSG